MANDLNMLHKYPHLHPILNGNGFKDIYPGAYIVFHNNPWNIYVDRHTDLSITKLMKYAAIDGVELHKVVDSGEGWVVIILSGGYVKISHDDKEFKFKLTIKLSGVWI